MTKTSMAGHITAAPPISYRVRVLDAVRVDDPADDAARQDAIRKSGYLVTGAQPSRGLHPELIAWPDEV